MNFFSKLFVSSSLFISLNLLAVSVSFQMFSLSSGYVDGVGQINISAQEDGKLSLTWDRNSCTADGRACTRMAPFAYTIDPIVIRDSRPVDGPLYLGLIPEMVLVVGSGYTMDGIITYTAEVSVKKGTEPVRVKLTPNVNLILNPKK